MRGLKWILAAAAVLAPATASAEWHKASTRHFIIYSEQSPDKLRAYAEKLERFDQAVRRIRKWDDPALGDGNRLTVYAVEDVDEVQRLLGRRGTVYGFFIPRYTGPVAFTPRWADSHEWGLNADSVFFHEYGHHLMFQQFRSPMPNWFVEGFAELVGGQRFEKDGSVTIGLAPKHRAYGLFMAGGLSTREILAAQPKKLNDMEHESVYGRGWLLTHYLLFEPARNSQLTSYFASLNQGKSMEVAATEAFGDLREFDRELERYLRRSKLTAVTVQANSLNVGKIDVTPLSPGAAAAIKWQMMSKRGVDEVKAAKVVGELRQVAAKYPTDPFVMGATAEAEYDVKQYARALAAADAALAIDPRDVQALVYRGRALMELADRKEKGATYDLARNAFLAANKVDAEDPEPLYLYYESFARGGKAPTPNAIKALHYASVLAPADTGVRLDSAVARLRDKQPADAREALLPVAYNPHGGEFADEVRAAVGMIDAGKPEDALAALLASQEKAERRERGGGDKGKNKDKDKN